MCSPSHSFLHIFLFTNIHNLSISLPHSLALSLSPMYLSPPLSSATFTITLQTCKPSSSLYLAHSLALISHPHPFYSLLFWMQPLSFSLSLFLPHVNSHFSNMYTIPLSLSLSLSLSLMCSLFSTCSHAHLFYFLSRSLSFSISLPSTLSLSSAMLTHFTIFCCGRHLPPFLSLPLSLTPAFSLQPHTHTLLSSVADTASFCLSSATLTITLHVHYPHISLSRCSPSLPTQPIVIRWIEVSIFPVFSICYANLNKRYNFCILLDDLVELTSMMLLARNKLSALFYSPLVGITSYLCELDINSSLFANQDA